MASAEVDGLRGGGLGVARDWAVGLPADQVKQLRTDEEDLGSSLEDHFRM